MQGCPERNKKTHPMHHTFMNSARKLRETIGYTQAEVAEKIGIDVQKYSRMERSVNFLPVTLDEAYKLSEALESSVITMTFGNRIEHWLHDLRELKGVIEESKKDVIRGANALEGVTQLLEAQEKTLNTERKSFNNISDYVLEKAENEGKDNRLYNMKTNNTMVKDIKKEKFNCDSEHDKSFEQRLKEIDEKVNTL
tara:strand:+ start:492 stop:1079 length:588 start_codon:yes stop_codon:yes gene_type:complete